MKMFMIAGALSVAFLFTSKITSTAEKFTRKKSKKTKIETDANTDTEELPQGS